MCNSTCERLRQAKIKQAVPAHIAFSTQDLSLKSIIIAYYEVSLNDLLILRDAISDHKDPLM